MKKHTILQRMLMLGIVISSFSACKKDPYEGITSNERSIEKFLIPGQIGVATVTSRSATESVATINIKKGTSLQNIAPSIQTSYKSSISPASGEKVSFAADSTLTYTVTAESGKPQTWKIKVKAYDFDLEGVWKISELKYTYHAGAGESWGWTGTKEFQWYMQGAKNVNDDTFEFKLEDVTPDGKLTGSFVHNLGADGKAATFVYDKDPLDMNAMFNKVPAGNGTWVRDFSTNTISFNSGAAVILPLEWQNPEKTKVKFPFAPGKQTFPSDLPKDDDRYEIQSTTSFWYTLEKVQ